jgi:hypothetical protein
MTAQTESAIARKLDELPKPEPQWAVVEPAMCTGCDTEKGTVVLFRGLPYLVRGTDRITSITLTCGTCGKRWRWYQRDAMRRMGITDTEDLPPFIVARKAGQGKR